jgi:hypothetical protein
VTAWRSILLIASIKGAAMNTQSMSNYEREEIERAEKEKRLRRRIVGTLITFLIVTLFNVVNHPHDTAPPFQYPTENVEQSLPAIGAQ